MLESTGTAHVLMDLQLIQVCPAHPMHSGVLPFWSSPEHLWHPLEAGAWLAAGTAESVHPEPQQTGSASHCSGALKASCGGGGFNSVKC